MSTRSELSPKAELARRVLQNLLTRWDGYAELSPTRAIGEAKELLSVATSEPASEMTAGQPAEAADEPEAVKAQSQTSPRRGAVHEMRWGTEIKPNRISMLLPTKAP